MKVNLRQAAATVYCRATSNRAVEHMLDWLNGIAGPEYAPAILWTAVALILFVVVLLIIKLVRGMMFGTFVAGGRNRKTRLAVMDATAVDSHRRLVLVRRDDIEHLLLIGGPTDLVVERDIRLSVPRRPALTGDAPRQSGPAQRRQTPAPNPNDIAHAASPAPQIPPARNTQPAQPQPPRTYAQAPKPTYATSAPASPVSGAPARQPDAIDDTLLQELELSLHEPQQQKSQPKALPTPDDDMARLLGELSSQKKR